MLSGKKVYPIKICAGRKRMRVVKTDDDRLLDNNNNNMMSFEFDSICHALYQLSIVCLHWNVCCHDTLL